MTRKGLYTLSAIIYICLMALIAAPPLTALIDRASPRILGMPCMQFFLFAVPITMAVWLIIWFRLDCKIDDRQEAKRREDEKGGEK